MNGEAPMDNNPEAEAARVALDKVTAEIASKPVTLYQSGPREDVMKVTDPHNLLGGNTVAEERAAAQRSLDKGVTGDPRLQAKTVLNDRGYGRGQERGATKPVEQTVAAEPVVTAEAAPVQDAHQSQVDAANTKLTFVPEKAGEPEGQLPSTQETADERKSRVQSLMDKNTALNKGMTPRGLPTDEQMAATKSAMSSLDRTQRVVEKMAENDERNEGFVAKPTSEQLKDTQYGLNAMEYAAAEKLASSDKPKEAWEVAVAGGTPQEIVAARQAELQRRFEEVDAKLEDQNYVPTDEDKRIIRQYTSVRSRQLAGAQSQEVVGSTALAIPEKLHTGTALAIPEKLQTGTALAIPEKPQTGTAVELYSESPMRAYEDAVAAMRARKQESIPFPGTVSMPERPMLTDSQRVPHVDVEEVTGAEADEIRDFVNKGKTPEIVDVEARIPEAAAGPEAKERRESITMGEVIQALQERELERQETDILTTTIARVAMRMRNNPDADEDAVRMEVADQVRDAAMARIVAKYTPDLERGTREDFNRALIREHQAEVEEILFSEGLVSQGSLMYEDPDMAYEATQRYYESQAPGEESGVTMRDVLVRRELAGAYLSARMQLAESMGQPEYLIPEGLIEANAQLIAESRVEASIVAEGQEMFLMTVRGRAERMSQALWSLERDSEFKGAESAPPMGITDVLDANGNVIGLGRLNAMLEDGGLERVSGINDWTEFYKTAIEAGYTVTQAVNIADVEFGKSVKETRIVWGEEAPKLEEVKLPPQPVHGGMPITTRVELGELGPEGPLTRDQDRFRAELEARGVDPYTAHRLAIGMTDERVRANLPEVPPVATGELPPGIPLPTEEGIRNEEKTLLHIIDPKEAKIMRGVGAGIGAVWALIRGKNPAEGALAGSRLAAGGARNVWNFFATAKNEGFGNALRKANPVAILAGNIQNGWKNLKEFVNSGEDYGDIGTKRKIANAVIKGTGFVTGLGLGFGISVATKLTSPLLKPLESIFKVGLSTAFPKLLLGIAEKLQDHEEKLSAEGVKPAWDEVMKGKGKAAEQEGYKRWTLMRQTMQAMVVGATVGAITGIVAEKFKKETGEAETVTKEKDKVTKDPSEPGKKIEPITEEPPVVIDEPEVESVSGVQDVDTRIGVRGYDYEAQSGDLVIGGDAVKETGSTGIFQAYERLVTGNQNEIIGNMNSLSDKVAAEMNRIAELGASDANMARLAQAVRNFAPAGKLINGVSTDVGKLWAEANGFVGPDAMEQFTNFLAKNPAQVVFPQELAMPEF